MENKIREIEICKNLESSYGMINTLKSSIWLWSKNLASYSSKLFSYYGMGNSVAFLMSERNMTVLNLQLVNQLQILFALKLDKRFSFSLWKNLPCRSLITLI